MAQKHQQQGFILAATLWLIAFITVAAAFIAQWADAARQQVLSQKFELQAELEFQGTLATLLYFLNTRVINEHGLFLNELTDQQKEAFFYGAETGIRLAEGHLIKLHDQTYQGLGSTIFSIQDENGLISSNSTDPIHLKYLLGLFGLKPNERDEAIDTLLDYQDRDKLHRLNGAEAQEYLKHNKPEPPNRPLLTSWELQNVLAWDQYPELWRQHLPRLTSSLWEGAPNFNVAPAQVLQTVIGITREDAEKLVQARKAWPIVGLEQIYQITGKSLFVDPLSLTSRPSNFIRISLWRPTSGRVREIHIESHPLISNKDYLLKSTKPWRVHYQLDILKTADQHHANPKPVSSDLFKIKDLQ